MGDELRFWRKAQRKWRKAKGFRDPYIAIMEACADGRGVSLTASDVRYIATDSAVGTVASNHAEEMLDDDRRDA